MKYETIYECPIINFQRVIETGDPKHLLKKYDKNFKEDLTPVFEKLNEQIIDEFGLNETSMLVFHKTREITKLRLKYIQTENESLTTDIQIAQIHLDKLIKRVSSGNINDIKKIHATNHRIISGWSSRDSRKLTVFEYYNDLKDYEKESDKIKPHAGKDRKRRTA